MFQLDLIFKTLAELNFSISKPKLLMKTQKIQNETEFYYNLYVINT